MSKIVLVLLLVGLVVLLAIHLLVLSVVTNQLASVCPSLVSTPSSSGTATVTPDPDCDPPSPQIAELEAARNADLQLLTFPTILAPVGGYTGLMGSLLLCMLAGVVIGNEYLFGTQRVALSRGASRAQLLAGQVGTMALLALALAGCMLLLGSLASLALDPALGASIPALAGEGFLQIGGFWLVLSLRLFAYTLVALFLATVSRSTAAGIAGSLGYLMVEILVLPIVSTIARDLNTSTVRDVLGHVNILFLGPNLDGLLAGIDRAPLDLGGGSCCGGGTTDQGDITAIQGLLVVLLYCVVLVGTSYWVLRKRDVTN